MKKIATLVLLTLGFSLLAGCIPNDERHHYGRNGYFSSGNAPKPPEPFRAPPVPPPAYGYSNGYSSSAEQGNMGDNGYSSSQVG